MKAKQLLTDNNLHNTHWGKNIIKAENRGAFTTENDSDAGNWVTCACGQHTKGILKDEFNKPDDKVLEYLGMQFTIDVVRQEFFKAAETLIQIEKRVIELLKDKSNES